MYSDVRTGHCAISELKSTFTLCWLQVEDAWKVMEFVVLPYKDYKETYILGGTDDIQVLLDDSNINISTIASSRHVGPIKSRVDDWVKQLDLFGKTLVGIRTIDMLVLNDVITLECVQNCLAIVVTWSLRFSQSLPLLKYLHWLPVRYHSILNICMITYQAVLSKQPAHLHSLLTPARNPRQLHFLWGFHVSDCLVV